MKPKAVIYSQSKTFVQTVVDKLSEMSVETYEIADHPKDYNYLFALITNESDIEKLKPHLRVTAKKVIAAPIYMREKLLNMETFERVKMLYYYELLDSEIINWRSGYANWIIHLAKVERAVYLPKEDLSIYPVDVETLAREMFSQAFSYFQGNHLLVSFETSLFNFSDWLRVVDNELIVSVDPSLKLTPISINAEDLENLLLTPDKNTIDKLYKKGKILKTDNQKKRFVFPKINLPFKAFWMLLFITSLLALAPAYLLMSAYAGLYIADKVDDRFSLAGDFLYKASDRTAQFTNGVSDFYDNLFSMEIYKKISGTSIVLSDTGQLGQRVLGARDTKDPVLLNSLYKELSFVMAKAQEEDLFFKSGLSNLDLMSLSREEMLRASNIFQAVPFLLGQEGSVDYGIVLLDTNKPARLGGKIESVHIFEIEDGDVLEHQFADADSLEAKLGGLAIAPSAFVDYRGDEAWKVKDMAWGPDPKDVARQVNWLSEKVYDNSLDTIVYIPSDIYKKLFAGADPKDFVEVATKNIQEIEKYLDSGEIVINSQIPEIDNMTGAEHWNGQVRTNSFFVFETQLDDATHNIERSASLDIEFLNQTIEYRFSLDLTNKSKSEYQTYVRTYAPFQASVYPVAIDGKTFPAEISNTKDKKVLGAYLSVAPQETKTLTFRWEEPSSVDFNVSGSWGFIIAKQTGIASYPFSIRVSVPPQVNLTDDSLASYNTNLSEEEFFEIYWK